MFRYCLLAVISLLPLLPRLFMPYCSSGPAASSSTLTAQQKRAYATFLSSSADASIRDAYFDAVRVLVYQILHHPETRTSMDIPLLVLASPDVSQEKRQVLTAEGATVIPVEPLQPHQNGSRPPFSSGFDRLSKLRLFEMTHYDRILYLSSDMLLTKPLDGIWDEAASQKVQCTRRNSSAVMVDEARLPSTYLFATIDDKSDALPAEGDSTLNSAFWLLRPDTELFEYYRGMAHRFDASFIDQGLLSYAHRSYGNMPPSTFTSHKWTTDWPRSKDFEGGCATLHDKFWRTDNAGRINRKLMEMWWAMQSSMEAFWSDQKA
jgi:alpha-N-acetylglucosamine transferase